MSTTSTAAAQVAELLSGAERAVALTGAGISVPSGIPDFRSPGTGLWENHDPMEVAHIDAWRRDPDRFWSFYTQRFATLTDKRPNEAHLALTELEDVLADNGRRASLATWSPFWGRARERPAARLAVLRSSWTLCYLASSCRSRRSWRRRSSPPGPT